MKKLKKLIVLLLSFAMLFSVCPVYAGEIEDYNYVYIGESTSLGYYLGDTDGLVNWATTYNKENATGYHDGNEGSGNDNFSGNVFYLFREYLEEELSGAPLNATSLQLTGMRPMDFRALIDKEYEKKLYESGETHWIDHKNYWTRQSTPAFGGTDALNAKDNWTSKDDWYNKLNNYYTSTIKNADLIVYDLAMMDMNSYFANRISSYLQSDAEDYESNYGTSVLETLLSIDGSENIADSIETVKNYLSNLLESYDVPYDKIQDILDIFVYSYANFTINFSATIEDIYELNPDAKLIVVGPYNPMAGLTFTYNGIEINAEKIWDYIMNMVTAHITTVSEHKDDYIFADISDGIDTCVSALQNAYSDDADQLADNINTLKNKYGYFVGVMTSDPDLSADAINSDIRVTESLAQGLKDYCAWSADDIIEMYVKASVCDTIDLNEVISALSDNNIVVYAAIACKVGDATGILQFYERFLLRHAIGAHPDLDGINQKFEAVKKAYESDTSAIKSTVLGFIKSVFSFFGNLLKGLLGDIESLKNAKFTLQEVFTPVIDLSSFFDSLK